MNFSCYPLLERRIKLHEMLKEIQGLCLSYVFRSIIVTSVLHQWRKSVVPEVMVSGLDLFQKPSFVVVTLSVALELYKPRAKAKHRLCRVQCRACGRQCYGP